MFARTLRLSCLALSTALATSTASAQVFPTRAFQGESFADFHGISVGAHKNVPTTVAVLNSASIAGFDLRESFDSATCGALRAPSGGRVMYTNDEYCVDFVEIIHANFREPTARFGANILAGQGDELSLIFYFYDEYDQEVGSELVTLAAGCDWNWVGFRTRDGVAATRMMIHNFNRDVVVMDFMTADFDALPPVGNSYCDTRSGAGAHISAGGSHLVADDDLILNAGPIPDGAGVFFYGNSSALAPFGNGTRCVAGTNGLVRVPAMGGGGVMTADVDLGPGARIVPGSTWYFQALYRDDAAGGARFDLSDALEIQFH